MKKYNIILIIMTCILSCSSLIAQIQNLPYKSIQDFGVMPENTPKENTQNLQKAIEWASKRGAALFVNPSETPYPLDGGIILLQNVSLIGVHGPVGRGTRHPEKQQPVGSVFRIVDEENVFITVEAATQIRGIQFWYPNQTISEPDKIIPYPPYNTGNKHKIRSGCNALLPDFLWRIYCNGL